VQYAARVTARTLALSFALLACGAPSPSDCPPATECPVCATCPERQVPRETSGPHELEVTEIVARPLRPDGLLAPPGCGVMDYWATTMTELRSVEPPIEASPEHLELRVQCPTAMTAECMRVHVPTSRWQDAALHHLQLQVTEPVAWIACPE